MARIVRAALLQAEWTGDKDSMIEKHIRYAREAAKQGAKVMCFQELFYGPYFCQVQDPQYYSYTEKIPDGPTTKRMQELAKETGMVLVVPMYEEDEHTSGIYYNTAAVIDADGSYLGKYRKTHIPQVAGFYDPYTKTLYVADWLPLEMQRPAMAHEIELTIHEGRNRQVRRMCAAVGQPVTALRRTGFGPLRLGRLAAGGHRRLTRAEVQRLRAL